MISYLKRFPSNTRVRRSAFCRIGLPLPRGGIPPARPLFSAFAKMTQSPLAAPQQTAYIPRPSRFAFALFCARPRAPAPRSVLGYSETALFFSVTEQFYRFRFAGFSLCFSRAAAGRKFDGYFFTNTASFCTKKMKRTRAARFVFHLLSLWCSSVLIFVLEISGVRGRYTTSQPSSFRKSNFPSQSSPITKVST